MHAETGYLRVVGDDQVEFVIAQPIGFAEISPGRISGTRIDVESSTVGRTPTAKAVTSISRSLWVEGETLHCETRMAMEGVRGSRLWAIEVLPALYLIYIHLSIPSHPPPIQTTYLYASDGTPLAQLHVSVNRQIVPLSAISS